MQTIDPRTPVLVGGGQLNQRDGALEPVDMIVAAARLAAREAGSERLLEKVDSVRVIGMLSWRYRDPGALVGERVGASVRHTGYTGNGGSNPQALVNAACKDITAGRCDVVLIGGAEVWRTRMALRADGRRPEWTVQDETVPKAELLIPDVPMLHESESRIGLDRPAYVYPLFEQALCVAANRTVQEHRARIGELWSRFSQIAAGNPHAWSRRAYAPEEITTPSPANRWISWPYTKLMNSNNMVEQAAAILLCSAEVATSLGIGRDKWVFPHAGTEAHDTYAIAERGELHRSPAIRFAGQQVLELAGVGLDDISLVDIYSCFPSAVQVAAHELGLPLDDPGRPLTITGGLTFAGGPWNNYSTHAIATLATKLRESPGGLGLVTANSGYLTKHALGVYGTEPPSSGFRREDVQAQVDAEPTVRALTSYEGEAAVESWTVVHDRDGEPERAFAALRTPGGDRTLATTTDPDETRRMTKQDVHGDKVLVAADGGFRFLH